MSAHVGRLGRLEARLPGAPAPASAAFRRRYRDDPVAFVRDCFAWPEAEAPADYQVDLLAVLPRRRRLSVRGPHGLGKTALAAWALLWFALTRDGAIDWKAVTTAGAWRQLTRYLWPEIAKWARRLRWERLGRQPFNARDELQTLALRLATGQAFAVASDDPQLIEGAHASEILYVFDESKSIPPAVFDAAEGAFSAGEAYALAMSTPGPPSGRFYEIHRRAVGYEDWATRHVTRDEAIAAGRISPEWAEQRKRQWGEASGIYQNRVLGEFAADDEDGVIPLSWVEAAVQRWHRWDEAGRPGALVALGVDVARYGEDRTVLAPLHGDAVAELRRFAKADTMATVGRVKGLLDANAGGKAIVDAIGVGAGVVDRLREQGCAVEAFNASAASEYRDRSGELTFLNARAAAWWSLRELLDPTYDPTLGLPPDDELAGDLTAPRWKVTSRGAVQIEAKEDTRARLARSPDAGDAVVIAATALMRLAPTEPGWLRYLDREIGRVVAADARPIHGAAGALPGGG